MTNPFVEAATAYLNQTIPLNEDRKTAQSAREYSDKHVAPYIETDSSFPKTAGDTRVSDEHASKEENNPYHKMLLKAGYTKKNAVGSRAETIKKDRQHVYTKPGGENVIVKFNNGKASMAFHQSGRYGQFVNHTSPESLSKAIESGLTNKTRRAPGNRNYSRDL